MSESLSCPIVSYFHCRHCVSAGRPDKIAVGLTASGDVVVWCDACDREIYQFDWEDVGSD